MYEEILNRDHVAMQLVEYIYSLNDFSIPQNHTFSYQHMGAILTDTILQAGLNYRNVVEPRVQRVIRNYPDATVTSAFLAIMISEGTYQILDWRHPEKPRRLFELTTFLFRNGIETEADLHTWLLNDINSRSLMNINGIGPKSVDYLKNLVNISTVAIDRHIHNFVKNAGLNIDMYDDIRSIVILAASSMDLLPSKLDHAIWLYMSNGKRD